ALPLSFAQERLWFIEQLDPGRPVYHMPTALRLEGCLDLPALSASLAEIVRRHEVLRTRFPTVGGKPVQVIELPAAVVFPLVDLSGLPEDWREVESKRLALAEARRPFDLSGGPLLRLTLLRRRSEDHVVLLTIHHIVTDGWSGGVLRSELSALYRAASQGLPSPLPELPVQYADFSSWQRRWLEGGILDAELAWWRERLAGAPPVLELPADRPRPAVRRLLGGRCPLELPAHLGEEVAALAHRSGVTQFMVLLAVFDALLHRLSGQEDLVVGSPIAGRNRIEIEGLIGFFVNTLVLRSRVEGEDSFAALLERVREVALGAYAHQNLPFERLVEQLQPERSLSHTPLFQVMFVWQSAPWTTLELPGLHLSSLPTDNGAANYDLILGMGESGGRLAGSLQYATDLFDRTTVERLLLRLERLLRDAVAAPERRISELPLLTESERRQLQEWNDTGTSYLEGGCLHHWVERQARRTPEATALVFAGESLSFGELDLRAEILARQLRSLGVRPEVRVGIFCERSLEMMVGLLAILKAGGAYVPLDPSYPAERLTLILEDSAVPVLLVQERLSAAQPPHRARVVLLVRGGLADAGAAQVPRAGDVAAAGPDALAYVIYTSGSTGRPKGVMISHRALWYNNMVCAMALHAEPDDVVLHAAPMFHMADSC
ncbi:MAG TPA: condensation domain-containing protein, partial [Thermoanaerobaculia bacterium]|nr:condensation domain-containing protein [Thermoanaerobaculia bacterium]